MMNTFYRNQVDLLLRIIPYIAKETDLALKGGTAINMFIWDMPRLSVDIDLTYIHFHKRDIALKNIEECIVRLKESITKGFSKVKIISLSTSSEQEAKLICNLQGVVVKIEINTVMRGTIKPPQFRSVSQKVIEEFGKFADIQVISEGELFGGKVCAALDRQHPRDLFDVKLLLSNIGFTPEIKQGFIVALLSHPRPINEILKPNLYDQAEAFNNQFAGMTQIKFTYSDFENTRIQLVKLLKDIFLDNEKQFILSFKAGEPKWHLIDLPSLKELPAVQWKLKNIIKLKKENPEKHNTQFHKLKSILDI